MQNFEPFTVDRPWGNFRQFNLNTPVTVKILTIKPNEQLSLQSHRQRSEFCKVVKGRGVAEVGTEKYNLKEGDEYNVSVNTKHRVLAGSVGLTYLEISTGNFDEADIIRYEDKYGRV